LVLARGGALGGTRLPAWCTLSTSSNCARAAVFPPPPPCHDYNENIWHLEPVRLHAS
jgi:hypothetical protein